MAQPKKIAANVDLTLLRKHLGLADDATEEDVNAALAATQEGEPAPEPTPAATEPTPAEEPTATEPEPVTASSEVVTIDRGTLADLQRRAGLGETAFETQRSQQRDDFLAAALASGKFPPGRLSKWQEAWEAEYKTLGSADGVKATIDAMPAGLIPVDQRGGQPSTEAASSQEAYPAHWLPEVTRRQQRETQAGRIVQEA